MLDDGIAMGNRLTQPPLYGKKSRKLWISVCIAAFANKFGLSAKHPRTQDSKWSLLGTCWCLGHLHLVNFIACSYLDLFRRRIATKTINKKIN